MAEESYESSIVICKPLEDVFVFVSNPRNFPLWTGASSVDLIGAEVPKIGARYKVTFSSYLSSSSSFIEIVGYKAPFAWSFRSEKPTGVFSYAFEPADNDTKVTLTYTGSQAAERRLVVLLHRLKRYIEKKK